MATPRCWRCALPLVQTTTRSISSRTAARISRRKAAAASPSSLKPVPPTPVPTTAPTSTSSTTPPAPLKSPSLYSDIFYDRHHHLTSTPVRATIDHDAPVESFFRKNPRFLYSASSLKDHPFNALTPEVVVLGASNVGKSSFLNALVSRSGTARVGPRPGKTTLMNAFGIGPDPKLPKSAISAGTPKPTHSLIVMDTPGYGFRSKADWGDAIVQYLGSRKMLRGAVVLLSSEKRLMDADRWILKVLSESRTRTLTVLTKVDKAKGGWGTVGAGMAEELQKELKRLEQASDYEWAEGSGWVPDVYLTAAGMNGASNTIGSGAGMGGIRSAILEMAGIDLGVKTKNEVKQEGEDLANKAYEGKVISFDDLPWSK